MEWGPHILPKVGGGGLDCNGIVDVEERKRMGRSGYSPVSKPDYLVVVDTKSAIADPDSSRKGKRYSLCRDLERIALRNL